MDQRILIAIIIVIALAVAYYYHSKAGTGTPSTNNPSNPSNPGGGGATMPTTGGTSPGGVSYVYYPHAVCIKDTTKKTVTATSNPGTDLDAMLKQGATNGIFQVNSSGIAITPVVGGEWVACSVVTDADDSTVGVGAFILATQQLLSDDGVVYYSNKGYVCNVNNGVSYSGDPIDHLPSGSVGTVAANSATWQACASVIASINPANVVFSTTNPIAAINTANGNTFTVAQHSCLLSGTNFTDTNPVAAMQSCLADTTRGPIPNLPCQGIVSSGTSWEPCYNFNGGANTTTESYMFSTAANVTPIGKKPYAAIPSASCLVSLSTYPGPLFTDAIDACTADTNVQSSGYPCVGVTRTDSTQPWSSCVGIGTGTDLVFGVGANTGVGAGVAYLKTPVGHTPYSFVSSGTCGADRISGEVSGADAIFTDTFAQRIVVGNSSSLSVAGQTFQSATDALDACAKTAGCDAVVANHNMFEAGIADPDAGVDVGTAVTASPDSYWPVEPNNWFFCNSTPGQQFTYTNMPMYVIQP